MEKQKENHGDRKSRRKQKRKTIKMINKMTIMKRKGRLLPDVFV